MNEEATLSPEVQQAAARLKSAGYTVRDARVVASTTELFDALKPNRTLVLQPGTYAIDAEGWARLESIEHVDIVGLGSPPPKLERADPADWILTLDGASDVRLVNVALHASSPSDKRHGGTLRVLSARDIGIIDVDLTVGSDVCVGVADSSRVRFAGVTVDDCLPDWALIDRSSDVVFERTRFWAHMGRPANGFSIRSSEVRISDSYLRDAQGRPDEAMFRIDPAEDTFERLRSGTPERSAVPGVQTRVDLSGSALGQNRFSALADSDEALRVASTTILDGQFTSLGRHGVNRRACTCYRRRTIAGSELVSSCWQTEKQCAQEVEALEKRAGPALASSVSRECATVYGRDPTRDAGWEAFFASGTEHSLRVGICSSDGPPSPASSLAEVEDPAAADERWKRQKVWKATANDESVEIMVVVETASDETMPPEEVMPFASCPRTEGSQRSSRSSPH